MAGVRRQLSENVRSSRRRALATSTADAGGPPAFYVQPVGAKPARNGPLVPDLLHAEPMVWGDLRGGVELVRFAFEGGDCEGVFDTLIEALPLAASTMDPAAFAPQLYLDDLIQSSMRITIEGESVPPRSRKLLRRVLETPPAMHADTETRQRVLAELVERPALRRDLEKVYLELRKLRDALELSTATEPNLVRRKIGVLVTLRQCVDALADGFAGSSSVLARLRERGAAIRSGDSWARLDELIDAEGNLATVDLRVRLGSDGTIRGFGVLAVSERPSALLPGPLLRFFQRMTSFFRGYRYGENDIVVRLLEQVFAPLAEDVTAILATTGAIETYLAALAFRDVAKEKGLEVCLPEIAPAPSIDTSAVERRAIEGLFNPLLFLQDVRPTPCDLPAGSHDALVVITGPNSGGKTRLLQSLALTQLLGQLGFFVPASRARLVRAPNLFLSLVNDTDAAQVEGRLGTELTRIRNLFEQLDAGTLAILDELCSGTNPSEGEDIFEMVVSLLPRLRPQVYVSTHFLGLAARLEREHKGPTLAFLQVELDGEEKPTYQFVPGVATTSLAHKVAARLGVTEADLAALVEAKIASRPVPALAEAPRPASRRA